MYYVQTANLVTREDFMKDQFVAWVDQELGLSDLAALLQGKLDEQSGLKDFFLPLEAANGYLTTAELQMLNVQLQKYDHMTGLEAKKLYADQFMQKECYVQAIHAYRSLLNDPEVISTQGHVAGDIWSNLGCAYARMQDFSEAMECFARGYMLNHRMETLQEAVDAACMSQRPELLEQLATRFATNAAQITSERTHIEQMIKQTMETTATGVIREQNLIRWLEDYRRQCEG